MHEEEKMVNLMKMGRTGGREEMRPRRALFTHFFPSPSIRRGVCSSRAGNALCQ